jgi:L-amino acid N-acyltransferase YncA
VKLIDCEPRRHSAPILAIFNEAIANSTALYDYQPRAAESMVGWFEAKTKGRYPVIGIEDESGTLVGFGSYGTFRAWPAYKYTVEHSIYIDSRFRGQGHGRVLLEALISAAIEQDYHVMVGGIDASNAVSIKLHESLGFTHCGTVKQAGFKFGRWLDLAFYQKILTTPAEPVDG